MFHGEGTEAVEYLRSLQKKLEPGFVLTESPKPDTIENFYSIVPSF